MLFHLISSGLSNGALYALMALGLITVNRLVSLRSFTSSQAERSAIVLERP